MHEVDPRMKVGGEDYSWHTWSNKCTSTNTMPGRLQVLDDGNVVISDINGKIIWETGTTDGKGLRSI